MQVLIRNLGHDNYIGQLAVDVESVVVDEVRAGETTDGDLVVVKDGGFDPRGGGVLSHVDAAPACGVAFLETDGCVGDRGCGDGVDEGGEEGCQEGEVEILHFVWWLILGVWAEIGAELVLWLLS